MALGFNKKFLLPEPKTQEQVQAEIDALTHTEFMRRLAYWMCTIGTHGASPYYIGGTLTPNGMNVRAFCNRLARINGDVEVANAFLKEFAERDARMTKDAEEVKAVTPDTPETLWLDASDLKTVKDELSITRCLLSTYPISGAVPLRTLTPEELKALNAQEL